MYATIVSIQTSGLDGDLDRATLLASRCVAKQGPTFLVKKTLLSVTRLLLQLDFGGCVVALDNLACFRFSWGCRTKDANAVERDNSCEFVLQKRAARYGILFATEARRER